MPIKVLLVEDSPIVRVILTRILSSAPDIQVVGMACNGLEGLSLLAQTQPDVICTDLHMPQMDGLAFTVEVMATQPRPILAISASVQADDAQNIFRLLDAGAVDIFPKPVAGNVADYEAIARLLLQKIRVLAGVRVFSRRRLSVDEQPQRSESRQTITPTAPTQPPSPTHLMTPPPLGILAIGASTGGPQALKTLLASLPATFPWPVLCVQHISAGFLQGLLDWLAPHCALPVSLATAGERPQVSRIYFPHEGWHLEFDPSGCFSYSAAASLSGLIVVDYGRFPSC
ncbi:MAG: response regulator, partial [Spirulinaceae cyanobacterium RM2_2_10]|nr:response regulator [Spirulinaceae cyanobacterium RM2_2_10]